MPNTLVIGGHGMKVTDGSKLWTLGDEGSRRLRECLETGTSVPSLLDLLWADDAVVYSYGCATLWKLIHDTYREQLAGKTWRKLAIVAGVADGPGFGQIKQLLWHKPHAFLEAWCWDVKAVPISSTLLDATVETVISSPEPVARVANIRCDELFPSFAEGVQKHKLIKENPVVIGSIRGYLLRAA